MHLLDYVFKQLRSFEEELKEPVPCDCGSVKVCPKLLFDWLFIWEGLFEPVSG